MGRLRHANFLVVKPTTMTTKGILFFLALFCVCQAAWGDTEIDSCDASHWSRPTVYETYGCEETYKRNENTTNPNAILTSVAITDLEGCKNWCSENSLCNVIYFSNEYQKCLWHNEFSDNAVLNKTDEFDEYVKETCQEEATVGDVPQDACLTVTSWPEYLNKWYCQWNYNSVPAQAYFECPNHGYPSSSEYFEDFTGDMPNYIHSTYQVACNALKNCCEDDANVTMLNEWELLPFLCSEKGHGIFQSSIEDQCVTIQLQTCNMIYRNSYTQASYTNHLSSFTTRPHHVPKTQSYLPTSSARWQDTIRWFSSIPTTFSPSMVFSSSSGSSFSGKTTYDASYFNSVPEVFDSAWSMKRGTTRPPSAFHKSSYWLSSWSGFESSTTVPIRSSTNTMRLWPLPVSQSTESPVTAASDTSGTSDHRSPKLKADNYLMAQFLAHFVYHKSQLNGLLNSVVECPDSSLLLRFTSEFSKSISMCQEYFDVDFESPVLATMFQAVRFPYDSYQDQNPFLREMYGSFARLSSYENCHTFIYFIYDSFKEGLQRGLITLSYDCDVPFNSTNLDSKESMAADSSSTTKQVRLILIMCNVIASSFLLCLLILCFIRIAQHRKRTKSSKKYRDALRIISMKAPPVISNETKGHEFKNVCHSLPHYDSRPSKVRVEYHEGNPFPPRHSLSTLSFKSEDPIVDAWEEPKKLSEKNKEIVKEWLEANEEIIKSRRESMFSVVSENKNV